MFQTGGHTRPTRGHTRPTRILPLFMGPRGHTLFHQQPPKVSNLIFYIKHGNFNGKCANHFTY